MKAIAEGDESKFEDQESIMAIVEDEDFRG